MHHSQARQRHDSRSLCPDLGVLRCPRKFLGPPWVRRRASAGLSAGRVSLRDVTTQDYSARHLQVLEGLEAVRKRPGMYVGSTDERGLMHCLWEIIDNSVDEALGGHGDRIDIVLHPDGSVEIRDRARGIPVDIEPRTGLSGVEVVFTKLHAGGKFGGGSYAASGGLHGVGASVVNALSARLDVEVDRAGKTYGMSFRRGEPGIFDDGRTQPSPDAPFTPFEKSSELAVVGKARRGVTGTRVRYWADPQIFLRTAQFNYDELVMRARQTAFLVPGLTVAIRDERGLTLIELVIGLVLMGFLVSAVLSFVRQQEMAFGFGSGKMSALQNYRFAADVLERNLRTAGTDIAPGQPFIVYADSATIAINANYATNDAADGWAVYRDLGAANAEVGSLPRTRRYTLPQTTFTYPDSTYRDGGAASSAETIIFYFAPDATTPPVARAPAGRLAAGSEKRILSISALSNRSRATKRGSSPWNSSKTTEGNTPSGASVSRR